MPNKRISDLQEKEILVSDLTLEPFPASATIELATQRDKSIDFLLARPKIRNEKISYSNLKNSVLDNSIYLTGNQLISGSKIFADPCTFLSRVNVNEFKSSNGDMSGYIFVSESGLFNNVGIGSSFFERESDINCSLEISGDSCFFGNTTQTGNLQHEGSSLIIGHTSLSGDLLIAGDIDQAGNAYNIGNVYHQGLSIASGDVLRKGSDFILGDSSQTGNKFSSGELTITGNTSLLNNLFEEGTSTKTGDLNQQGQDFYSGSLTLTGNSLLFGDQTVSDDIYLGQTVYHKNDEDTLVRLTNNKIDIEAGTTTSISLEENGEESVKFFTSGEEQMRQTKEGFIGINTTTPIAELSVTGEAFLENAFAYDRDCGRKFRKVFGGDDETVAFKTHLKEGEEEYKIELPKTFKVKPIISAELQHENGGIILPLIISNVSTRDFVLKLGSTLPDKHYHLHTTALSPSVLDEVNAIHYSNFPQVTCSDHASNRHGIQRFSTRIQQDSNEHEITFPFGYSSKPIVTVTIEGPNNIIPYAISSVNNSSYKIIFGTNVNQDYTIHTFSSAQGTKRLG